MQNDTIFPVRPGTLASDAPGGHSRAPGRPWVPSASPSMFCFSGAVGLHRPLPVSWPGLACLQIHPGYTADFRLPWDTCIFRDDPGGWRAFVPSGRPSGDEGGAWGFAKGVCTQCGWAREGQGVVPVQVRTVQRAGHGKLQAGGVGERLRSFCFKEPFGIW